MNKPKHTPGPWFADANFVRQVDDSGLIAEIYISPNQNDGRNTSLRANANLIAAAPDLLAFAELCMSLNVMVPEAKALIAKARGES